MKGVFNNLFWGLGLPGLLIYISLGQKNPYWYWIISAFLFWAVISSLLGKIQKAVSAPNGICPECRSKGAKSSFKGPRCPNSQCPRYDASVAGANLGALSNSSPLPNFRGNFDPGADAVRIHYRNFEGDDRVFTGDAKSLRKTKRGYTIKITPTGKRISLIKKFLKNPLELDRLAEAHTPPETGRRDEPFGADRQVLAYHLKRKSTSAKFEAARRKYPNWTPKD